MNAPAGYDAIVIGSGFGGLAAAIRLQSAGMRTLLLERRDRPGGRAYVYEDKGFIFDAGPTVITDPQCLSDLFSLSGRRIEDYVELMPVAPFYRLQWDDGYVFDYEDDQASLDAQIGAKSPKDVDGYRRFLAYSKALLEEGYVNLGHVPFPDFRSMLRVAPELVRLKSYKTVYVAVSDYITDPHLRQAFSFHSLLVGGNPFDTSAIYAMIHALERRWGVWFPKGGTGALINALCRLFADLGGDLELRADVREITTRGASVTGVALADGRTVAAPVVISNADVVHTYKNLLSRHPRGKREAGRLSRKRFSMSLFVIYFGLRTARPEVKHHTVLFGPRYEELLEEIFKGHELPEDFSLYLHAPSVTDPTLAPEGAGTFYVLAPVPHLGNADIDWDTVGPAYRDKILGYLEEKILPGLKDDLATCRIFTPNDFKTELNAHLGSAFSLEPLLLQSAYFRTHNEDKALAGLYFVGAGTHPGAGVPGVVASARATTDIILSKRGKARAA